MPLVMEVGLGPGEIVLDGDPAPPKKWHGNPRFSAHVCCGQTARWIKMPLGTDVDLVPPSQATLCSVGHSDPPLFGPCLLWPNSHRLSYC